jgi:hypothetical protein
MYIVDANANEASARHSALHVSQICAGIDEIVTFDTVQSLIAFLQCADSSVL